MFTTIAMTGMDQDMMQKNLSCRTLRESQRNMMCYGASFIPVNLLFLALGVLLYRFAASVGLTPWCVRMNSFTPYSLSRVSICCMIALGVMNSLSAALVKLPDLHTWIKVISEGLSMRRPPRY